MKDDMYIILLIKCDIVSVYWNDIVCGWELSGWSCDVEYMAEG